MELIEFSNVMSLGKRWYIIDNKTKYTIIYLWKILVHETHIVIIYD